MHALRYSANCLIWTNVKTESAREPRDAVRPATRDEVLPVAVAALVLAFIALLWCTAHGYLLLYGDAVAHLHIARRILDSRNPGLSQLGGVWLPLPHLLLLPFVQKMEWWQTGLAGAMPSMVCYVLASAGMFRLARYAMPLRWALVCVLFFALNPGLLYLSTTAMTEPLFLALVIWSVVLLSECMLAIHQRRATAFGRNLLGAGALLVCAVYTRYDGWIIAAAAWVMVLALLAKQRNMWKGPVLAAFAVFTLILIAAPLGWLAYNARYFHDPLDFMRGPYSAKMIELRTTPPGSFHYPGWHDPMLALRYYMKTAEVDAIAGKYGVGLTLLAFGGLVLATARPSRQWALLLLWIPLPFYAYSVSYGSVPIFIPQWWPHSFYNSRYGLELLPALVLFGCLMLAQIDRWIDGRDKRAAKYLLPVVVALIAANTFILLRQKPLVLQEALANSATRIPFEAALARQLEMLPPGTPILMYNSDHVGALQQAGIELKRTVNEFDSDSWQAALRAPAASAAFVVAIDGDPVAAAIKSHPAGLDEAAILCTMGQPCARLYQSTVYGSKRNNAP